MTTADRRYSLNSGYHQFIDAETGDEFGSFEVFWHDGYRVDERGDEHFDGVGWYWAAGFPGCLYDSDPTGPFNTSLEAREDACPDVCFCVNCEEMRGTGDYSVNHHRAR